MAGVQPTLIKVQQKFSYTNINTIEKFVKQTLLGKHRVDFRTAVTSREGSAREWTSTGTSASSGEVKVGVKNILVDTLVLLLCKKVPIVWDGPTLVSIKDPIYLWQKELSV